MLNFTDLTGLASVSVAISAAVLSLPGIVLLTRNQRVVLLAVVLLLMLIPFGGMPFAAYVRGVSGDLSITLLVLLGCVLAGYRPISAEEINQRHTLLMLIAMAAILLYPLALGLASFDPYRLGYGDPWFVATLLLIALTAWTWKHYLIASCIALATIAWSAGWYESGNICDYLLDPWLAIYALFSRVRIGAKSLLKQLRARTSTGAWVE